MRVYKVWIEIEECDEENDRYDTVDILSFGATETFSTQDEALAFAIKLHDAGTFVNQLHCQHGQPENPGPCPYCTGAANEQDRGQRQAGRAHSKKRRSGR